MDNKRGTGRTTRMLLAAYEYILKHNAEKSVRIIVYNSAHAPTVLTQIRQIIPKGYWSLFNLSSYANYQLQHHDQEDDVFIDHFCYDSELNRLTDLFEETRKQLELVTKWSSEYDAKP